MTMKGESSLTNGYTEVPKTSFKPVCTETENALPKLYPPPSSHPWLTLLNGHHTHTHAVVHGFGILLLIILSTDVTVHQQKLVYETKFQS